MSSPARSQEACDAPASPSPSLNERRPLMADAPRGARSGSTGSTSVASRGDGQSGDGGGAGGGSGQSGGARRRRARTAEEDAAEDAAELRAGARNMVKLILPVVLCMAVVCISILAIDKYKEQSGVYLPYTPYHEEGTISGGERFGQALVNVLIILGVVITLTCVLVCLIKYRCYKAVTVWLVGASVLALGWFSFYYYWAVMNGLNWGSDTITAVIFGWNFCIAGVLAIHWRGPLHVQQFYLIATCVLISLIFISYLPDWTAWVLLALIAVYDLVAVLAPCGPLKKLVEIAQERDEPLMPSLVYSTTSTMAWSVATMADAPGRTRRTTSPRGRIQTGDDQAPLVSSADADPSDLEEETLDVSGLHGQHRAAREALGSTDSESDRTEAERRRRAQRREEHEQGRPSGEPAEESEPDEEEDKGVKLGLGDFIFYSVLVGRATKDSSGDFNVILACFIAIVIGLCLTTLLLAVLRKALPALPISIAFGLIFYFATNSVITPFTSDLNSAQAFI